MKISFLIKKVILQKNIIFLIDYLYKYFFNLILIHYKYKNIISFNYILLYMRFLR